MLVVTFAFDSGLLGQQQLVFLFVLILFLSGVSLVICGSLLFWAIPVAHADFNRNFVIVSEAASRKGLPASLSQVGSNATERPLVCLRWRAALYRPPNEPTFRRHFVGIFVLTFGGGR